MIELVIFFPKEHAIMTKMTHDIRVQQCRIGIRRVCCHELCGHFMETVDRCLLKPSRKTARFIRVIYTKAFFYSQLNGGYLYV
jgi:hypothetical protein